MDTQQLQTLLEVSKAITTVRDRKQLLNVIYQTIKTVFPYDNAGLFVLDKTGRFFTEILDKDVLPDLVQNQLTQANLSGPFDYHGHPPASWFYAQSPVICSLADQSNLYSTDSPERAIYSIALDQGLRQMIGGPLVCNDQKIGFIAFNSSQENAYTEADTPFFNAITDQLALAVANIVANEEILQRERERDVLLKITQALEQPTLLAPDETSLLLAVSRAIATIRDRKELLATIFEQIKPIIPVDDTGILVLDSTGQYWQDWTSVDDYQQTQASAMLQQLGYDQWLPMDRFGEYTLTHTGIMTVAHFKEHYPEHPFGPVMWEVGLREMLYTPLVNGGRKLGVLFFDAEQEGTYTEQHVRLFKPIADLIAAAVHNILANEEILERKQEKTKLLAISEAITMARTPRQFLRLVYERVQLLFPFDDAGLFTLDTTGQYHRDWVIDYEATDPSENFTRAGITGYIPHANTPIAAMMAAPTAALYSFDDITAQYPGHPQEEQMRQMGFKHLIAGPLLQGGETIGLLCFLSKQADYYSESQLPLFRAISNQLTPIVANILANEEILEREREKTLLLSISGAISSTRNAEELLAVIREKVQQLIPFYDTGIIIVEEGGQYHYDLAVTIQGWDPTEANRQLYEAGLHRIHHPGSYIAHVMELIDEAHGPIIDDYEKSYQQFDYVFFPVLKKLGYKEGIIAELKSGGKVIGTFWLNSLEKGLFNEKQFPLFQAVADQVAVAVANILANEEILEREREKSVLLSISEAIASARNAVELLTVIRQKAQQLIPFYDTGILIVEADGQFHFDLAVNLSGWDESDGNRQLRAAGYHRIPHSESYVAYVMDLIDAARGPIIEDYQLRYEEFDYPFFSVGRELGYKEAIVTSLKSGGNVLGTFWLNSLQKSQFKPQQFEIFQALADQVAVAVANILANEEILQREQEKSVLLSISTAIATINDKHRLLKLIFEQVRPLFGFDDVGLSILEKDGQHFNDWATQFTDTLPLDIAAKQLVKHRFPYAGSLIEQAVHDVITAGHPLVYNLTAELAEQWPYSRDFLLIEMADSQKEALVTTLRTGGKLLGLFNINTKQVGHFSRTNQHIFQAVADQVAVAVSNILANEEILEREQEKSVLLSLSEDMATIRDRNDLWRVMMSKVKPLVGFNDAVVGIYTNNGTTCNHILTVSPAERINNPHYAQVVDTDVPIVGSPIEYPLTKPKHYIFPLEELINLYGRIPVLLLMAETGLTNTWHIKLNWAGQNIGFVHFHFTHKDQIRESQHHLINSIADQVAVAVANILAKEEILEREREKTLLLNISNSIAKINHKADLLKSINELLWPLFHHDDACFCVVDKEKEYFTDYYNLYSAEILNSPEAPDRKGVIYKQIYKKNDPRLPFPGSFVEYAMKESPAVGRLEDIIPLTVHAGLIKSDIEAGLVYYLSSPLNVGGKSLGLFMLDFKEQNKPAATSLHLFSQIAEMMAIAMANIMANEEIVEREREKSHLLEISQAIAQVQNTKQLLRIIYEHIKPVFPYDNAGLYVFDQAGENYWGLLDTEVLPDETQIELEKANLLGPYAYKGHHPDLWGYAETAAIYSRPTQGLLFAEGSKERIANDIIVASGLKQMIGGPLYCAGRKIGLLCFNAKQADFYTAKHIPLYNAIADQISVALANIVANEETLKREHEKALELGVIKALTDGYNWEQKMLALARAIQPYVPFDYVTLGLVTEGQSRHSYTFYQTGYDEYETLHPAELVRLCGLSPERYHKLSQPIDVSRSLRLNGTEFEHFCRQDELKRIISQTFRLQSHLVIPIPMTQNGCLLLSFYCRQTDAYLDFHLDLLSKLRQSIALTLDRLLAYEEVEALSKQLQQENTYLQEEVRTNYSFEAIVGTSQAISDVFQKVSLVGPMTSTVLILGETGTGKELVARAIHQSSPRKAKPMIKVNCAALPAQLIESELFGHERGAFTGAIERRIGKFELAHESTIFLDEIGELPLELQAKLLRAIQEREIERLGSNKVIQVDVRVLAATNRNLEKEVADGRFRSDLYFRLNVYPIKLPPLRERREDIPLLAIHFSQKLTKKLGKPINGLSNGAIKEMQSYHWPGNIRELEHVIERGAIESVGGTIRSLALLKKPEDIPSVPTSPAFQIKSYADGERELLINTLRYCNGRIRGAGGAAEILNVKATTLEARMKKLGIKREFFIADSANPPTA
ncbi:sigma 54-interacting transcriptional regulator [Spirosoma arcticum]